MDYPVWDTGTIGGGSLIALIAITHVYISQLAVGGGIYLWWLDRVQLNTGDKKLEKFLDRFSWAFLLVTMVYGGVTGVGIWFVIGLVQPQATSALIHNFVFGWATEWVFFFVEIAALLLYHYRFSKMDRMHRSHVALVYAFAAWMSLAIINGILSFMLTPGDWVETRNVWDGFFNPTYWSSTVWRTFICISIAGVFGVLVGAHQKAAEVRRVVVRQSAGWLVVGLVGAALSAWWMIGDVPQDVLHTTLANPKVPAYVETTKVAWVVLLAGALLALAFAGLPRAPLALLTWGLAAAAFIGVGGTEYVRENARRPWVIQGYMYSNGITVDRIEAMRRDGALAHTTWVSPEARASKDPTVIGEVLFRTQCMSCHTLGGTHDIKAATEHLTYMGLVAQLTGQGKVFDYMPPFVGTDAEKKALANYLASLHGKPINEDLDMGRPIDPLPPVEVPELVKRPEGADEYVLLAWNDLGMHCFTDSDKWFSILPPANSLQAQLIKRGEKPEIITEGVELTYTVAKNFEHPERHLDFWKYSESLWGAKLEEGVGLKGNRVEHGEFEPVEHNSSWGAEFVPVSPYTDDGKFNPYPTYTVEARRGEELLARTRMVAPVSTEMGCRNCHGGGVRFDDRAGVADETAINILKAHDKHSGTTLYADALAGKPRACQQCHADPGVGMKGDPTILSMSAAVHGFHANYMHLEGQTACASCHPAGEGGQTECLRGVHAQAKLECQNCHGSLDEHSIALLKSDERVPGRAQEARQLMRNLSVTQVASKDDVKPRSPWMGEVDCLTCHQRFHEPKADASGFNKWTPEVEALYRERTDMAGLRCEGCHGSTHAVYPAKNPYDPLLDSMQPLQYQGNNLPIGADGNCGVCHTNDPQDSVHHPNQVRPFRNREFVVGQ